MVLMAWLTIIIYDVVGEVEPSSKISGGINAASHAPASPIGMRNEIVVERAYIPAHRGSITMSRAWWVILMACNI